MTVFEGAERAPRAGEPPRMLTARTWKLYPMPLVSPVRVVLVAVAAMLATVWSTAPPAVTTTW